LAGGQNRFLFPVFWIPATFAINAVERTHFTVGWQQVYAERDAQPAAFYGAEYDLIE
jgi:hypothetical protein